MDPIALEQASKAAQSIASGGVPSGVVYVLALFMFLVVGHLLLEHKKNYKTLVITLENNNHVIAENSRERRLTRKLLRRYLPRQKEHQHQPKFGELAPKVSSIR